jgi:hypothetical protein
LIDRRSIDTQVDLLRNGEADAADAADEVDHTEELDMLRKHLARAEQSAASAQSDLEDMKMTMEMFQFESQGKTDEIRHLGESIENYKLQLQVRETETETKTKVGQCKQQLENESISWATQATVRKPK